MANILVIEGGDKLGKETQTKLLLQYLLSRGKKAKLIEVPVDNGISYRLIYKMLDNGLAVKLPNVFQAIHFFNKYLFQLKSLSSLTEQYDYLIFDRWSLSSIVYGEVSRVNVFLNKFFYDSLMKPNRTVVLTGTPFFREGSDAYEKDEQLQANVIKLYTFVGKRLPNHYLINANQTREKVHADVLNAFDLEVL